MVKYGIYYITMWSTVSLIAISQYSIYLCRSPLVWKETFAHCVNLMIVLFGHPCCKFDWSRPVPYFYGDWSWDNGDWSWDNFYVRSSPFYWFKKGCCQLQANVCAWITGKLLSQAWPGKSRWTECPTMTMAVDWDVKNQAKQTVAQGGIKLQWVLSCQVHQKWSAIWYKRWVKRQFSLKH